MCSRQGPDSDLLRTFLAVAEQGNVTRAASRIARTQSGVSIHIRRLEEQLGVELFRRLPRGMALTSAVAGNMIARSDLPPLPPAALVLLRDNTRSRPVLDVMEHAILSAFGRTA